MFMAKKSDFAKRALALLIAAALVGTFASCGDDSKKSKNKGQNGSSQATRAAQGPNIIEFDDTDEEDDNFTQKHSDEDEVVTTTTTTAPSRTKKTTTTESTTAKTTESTKATTKATTAATQPAPALHNKYKVTYKTYSAGDGKLTYKYPQISGLYDEEMQTFYNDYFKTSCTRGLNDDSLEFFKGTYEVKNKTKDTLSIVFREGFAFKGAAHGYATAYAITIDLASGNTVIPSESVDMDKVSEAIENESWTLTRSVEGVTKRDIINYFNDFSEDAIKDMIAQDDVIRIKHSGSKYTVSGKTACNSYFDINGDPVLILGVSHALGDYVEVQF